MWPPKHPDLKSINYIASGLDERTNGRASLYTDRRKARGACSSLLVTTVQAVQQRSHYWAHSMGPKRSPLSRVVVVVIVDVVVIDAQAARDSTASDPW